jgi:ACR3 family arsenite transporter
LLIALPLSLQTILIFVVGYALAYALRLPHNIAAPAAFIGSSNFFELGVAISISVFGLNSGAALANVVGVLVEVPLMLAEVWFALKTQKAFDRRSAPPAKTITA